MGQAVGDGMSASGGVTRMGTISAAAAMVIDEDYRRPRLELTVSPGMRIDEPLRSRLRMANSASWSVK